jgi:hypothetical protein
MEENTYLAEIGILLQLPKKIAGHVGTHVEFAAPSIGHLDQHNPCGLCPDTDHLVHLLPLNPVA